MIVVKFMIFDTTDAKTAIPVDVQIIPRNIAEYVFVRHVWLELCLLGHIQLLRMQS